MFAIAPVVASDIVIVEIISIFVPGFAIVYVAVTDEIVPPPTASTYNSTSFNGLAPSKSLPESFILSPILYPEPPANTEILSYAL